VKVIHRLAQDLREEFSEIQGLSSRNLKYMRAFAETYSGNEFVQQLVAQIPRSKNGVVAEYVLRDINKPMGVAEWTQALTKSLPDPLQSKLPSVEELEAELDSIELGDS
jgi:hypothetical protein